MSDQTQSHVSLLQTFATLAGIAVALAAIIEDQGPVVMGVRLLPWSLVLANFVLLFSSVTAMFAVWADMGLRVPADLAATKHSDHPNLSPNIYTAVVVGTWGLWLTGIAGIMVLFVSFE